MIVSQCEKITSKHNHYRLLLLIENKNEDITTEKIKNFNKK